MATATFLEWKQFVEGLRRGDVGPYEWRMRTAGINRFREYFDGPTRRAWMRVDGAAQNNPNANTMATNRQYDIHPQDISATAYIYVPTSEDLEDWDEGINCLAGCEVDAEIAAREPVV